MQYQSTSGLDVDEVTELVARIYQAMTSRGLLPRWKLGLRRQVEITLIMLRQNLAQQLVADLVGGISQPTISRTFRRIVPVLEEVTCLDAADLAEAVRNRVVLVDGTYVPTGNRAGTGTTNYSGKHHVPCPNVQVAAALDDHVLDVSTPVPGAGHDSGALAECGWDVILDNADWIGDSGYTGHVPTGVRKKPAGQPRPAGDKVWNRSVASMRAPVERMIGHWKNWKVVATGWRGRLTELPRTIRVITLLERYRTGW